MGPRGGNLSFKKVLDNDFTLTSDLGHWTRIFDFGQDKSFKHSIGEFLQIEYGPDKAKKWREKFFDKDFTYNQKTWFFVTAYP